MPLPMLATMVLRMGVGNGMGSYWIMGVSVVMSALIGLGWSLARRKYDAKEETAEESERQSAYRSYLQKNEALLQQRGQVLAAYIQVFGDLVQFNFFDHLSKSSSSSLIIARIPPAKFSSQTARMPVFLPV